MLHLQHMFFEHTSLPVFLGGWGVGSDTQHSSDSWLRKVLRI